MASRIPKQYKEMLREAYKEGSVPNDQARPLKRRRKSRSRTPTSPTSDNGHSNLISESRKAYKQDSDSEVQSSSKRPISNSISKDRIVLGPQAKLELSGSEISLKTEAPSPSHRVQTNQDVVSLLSSDEDDDYKVPKVPSKSVSRESSVSADHNSMSNFIILDVDEEEEDDDDDEFDDADFEDVDISGNNTHPYNFDAPKAKEAINVVLKTPAVQTNTRKKKANRENVINTEERIYRRNMHMMYLASMVAHGVIRNAWSSDLNLMTSLRTNVPKQIIDDLVQYRLISRSANSVQTKTRKLLDILKRIMIFWYKSFTVSSGERLTKHLWVEFAKKEKVSSKVTKEKFRKMIETRRGSRQVAVQGFVSLLRCLGLQSRLIYSIQPPDFTNMQRDDSNLDQDLNSTNSSASASPRPQSRGGPSTKKELSSSDRILQALRVPKGVYSNSQTSSASSEKVMKYPVMWCEVWDKDAKKWITIDPIVQKKIDIVARRSSLEPPLNEPHNNTFYVISYDNYGGVRDVTRRYSQHYNAKVRKKRITREPRGEIWWDKILLAANTPRGRKIRNIDIIEKHEFETRSMEEGMPNSIQDFKGHPIYVLEEHLRQNEILHPKISRGTIRKKSAKGSLTPVYARKYVHIVRSAKAWYLRGRVLKMAERPMKIRENKPKKRVGRRDEDDFRLSDNDGDFDDDDDVNLFAEFQTELYVPPPIVDGKIPVNAYGNIDVYTQNMIPKGAAHVEGKFAGKAAKLVGVEYVNAVTGFDFTGGGTKSRGAGMANVKMNGVVVLEENAEAVRVVAEYLEEQEIEETRKRQELIALRGWKVLLSKLRIQERLNSEHGYIAHDDTKAVSSTATNTEKPRSRIYDYDFEGSDSEATDVNKTNTRSTSDVENAYGGGGFLVDHNDEEELHFSADDIDDVDGYPDNEYGPIDVDDDAEEIAEDNDGVEAHHGLYDFGDPQPRQNEEDELVTGSKDDYRGFYDFASPSNEYKETAEETSGGGFYDFDGDSDGDDDDDERNDVPDLAAGGGGFTITEDNSQSERQDESASEETDQVSQFRGFKSDATQIGGFSNEINADADTYGRCFAEFDADSDDDDDNDDKDDNDNDDNRIEKEEEKDKHGGNPESEKMKEHDNQSPESPQGIPVENEHKPAIEIQSDAESFNNEILGDPDNYGHCFGLYDTDGDDDDLEYTSSRKIATVENEDTPIELELESTTPNSPSAEVNLIDGSDFRSKETSTAPSEDDAPPPSTGGFELKVRDLPIHATETPESISNEGNDEEDWSSLSGEGEDDDNAVDANNNDVAGYDFEYSDSE